MTEPHGVFEGLTNQTRHLIDIQYISEIQLQIQDLGPMTWLSRRNTITASVAPFSGLYSWVREEGNVPP